jgi:hypothetical protein
LDCVFLPEKELPPLLVSLGFYKKKIGLKHQLKSGTSPLSNVSFLFIFPSWPNGDKLGLIFLLLAKKSSRRFLPKERKVVSSHICFAFLLTVNFISLKIAAAE